MFPKQAIMSYTFVNVILTTGPEGWLSIGGNSHGSNKESKLVSHFESKKVKNISRRKGVAKCVFVVDPLAKLEPGHMVFREEIDWTV